MFSCSPSKVHFFRLRGCHARDQHLFENKNGSENLFKTIQHECSRAIQEQVLKDSVERFYISTILVCSWKSLKLCLFRAGVVSKAGSGELNSNLT